MDSNGGQVASVATVMDVAPELGVPLLQEVNIRLVANRAIKPSQSNFFTQYLLNGIQFVWIYHTRLSTIC